MGTFSFQSYAEYRPFDFKISRVNDAVGAAEKRHAETEGRNFGRRILPPVRTPRLARALVAA